MTQYSTPYINFLENHDETGGNSNTANINGTAKWYKEPPFNYDESELKSCNNDEIYNEESEKLTCYATVDSFTDIGPVLITDWLSDCCLIG